MRRVLSSVVVLALAACSTSSPTGSGDSGPSVSIADYAFSPGSLSVKMGASVRWTNTGPSGHSVTSDSAAFDSGTLSGPMGDGYGGMTAGATFVNVFSTAGTFPYHCAIHASMHGTITVTP